MTKLGHRESILRTVISLAIVAAALLIIPMTPLNGQVGALLAVSLMLVCSWHSGPATAAIFPLMVILNNQLRSSDPKPWSQELFTGIMLSLLTTSLGIAGATRRRYLLAMSQHQRRLSEQARALAAARIVFCDLDDRIVGWSEGAQHLFGWIEGEVLGRVSHEMFQTEFPCPRPEVQRELLEHKQWQGEVRLRHRDGAELQIHLHSIVSEGDDGVRTGIIHIYTDVTALRRAENAARDADRRKDLFLAVLAHELRNPLAPIRNGVHLLGLSRDLSTDDRETLDIMQRQLEHLIRLVDDLLDVSRINSGKIKLQLANVPLAEIIQNAVDCVRPRMVELGHDFQVDVIPADLLVHADEARLTQVLANLLNNAAKFTPSPGRITLQTSREGERVALRVTDNGKGIAPELLPRIFEMFTQSEELLSRGNNGLGIGLCLVKTLVEMHGGRVEAQSRGVGQGSEFTVRIPIVVTVTDSAPSFDGNRHHRSPLENGFAPRGSLIDPTAEPVN